MIQCSLSNLSRYAALHPGFQKLTDFLSSHDLSQLPIGRTEIDGDALYINKVETELLSHEAQDLEVHRQYIDVHIPLSASEIIGWSPLQALREASSPYDDAKDFALYSQLAQVYTNITPGQCFVAFPEDAHAPIIGYGRLSKAIVKIKL